MGVRYSMGIAVTAAMACEVSVWRGSVWSWTPRCSSLAVVRLG